MKANSLAFRLVLSSAAWTIMILSVTAAILISTYRDLVEDNFDTRLNQYLEYLVSRSTWQGHTNILRPDNLGEPLFTQPLSGWYWQIKEQGTAGEPIHKSESLIEDVLVTPSEQKSRLDAQLIRQAYIEGPEGQFLRAIEREINITQDGQTKILSYVVAGDAIEIEAAITDFTQTLVLTLILLATGLSIATFFQVRFGLSPLRDIGHKVSAIRSGMAERLEGSLPDEIRPLQDELNALISANATVVERARTHVGNLAHALKTPLSVIVNEARSRDGEFAQKVVQQTAIMSGQITHYLDRARIAAQIRTVGTATDVKTELDSLGKALAKIYESKGLGLDIQCPDTLRFLGEKQDFQEMAGNLMDNAFKWARAQIQITVEPGALQNGNAKFDLIIADDGPGLPEEFRRSAVTRGRRLDESIPGSGLGLSIVADLSHLYNGSLHLEAVETGGLKARLVLPAARDAKLP
jgi:signal transduction histidine kinase